MTSLLLDRPRATALAGLHREIDLLQGLTGADDPDGVVAEIDRAVRRMESLKLGVVAHADAARVAAQTGLANTTAWLSHRTRSNAAAAAAQVKLATALAPVTIDSPPRPCAEALAEGAVSVDHAEVIVKATEQLPVGLSTEEVARVEEDLVAKAASLSPEQLRRSARRTLAAIEADAEAVDRHEGAVLRTEEQTALEKTRLTLHDNGDGTTSGHFTVPTLAASVLRKIIHTMTAPRRAHLGATTAQAGVPALRDWAHASGLAFVEVLEHLPTDHLHGKVAATVVVTVDHTKLTNAVGAAHLDTGDALSAGEVRRLACGAGILPAILDGPSLPLDLGRSNRLFTESQRVALATRFTACAADGCDRPFAWTEIHHERAWSEGGSTDLANAIAVCHFHHRRIHDPAYEHRRNGDVLTFHRRT